MVRFFKYGITNSFSVHLQVSCRCHHVYDIWIRYFSWRGRRSICYISRTCLDRYPRAFATRTKHYQYISVPKIHPSLDTWSVHAEIGRQCKETVDGLQNWTLWVREIEFGKCPCYTYSQKLRITGARRDVEGLHVNTIIEVPSKGWRCDGWRWRWP